MSDGRQIAVAQIGSVLGNVSENLERVAYWIDRAARNRISMLVFPECALSGYMFAGRDDLAAVALSPDGPELAKLADLCRVSDIVVVVGYCEKSPDGVFNAACIMGPDGIIGNYRKRHLPYLGADRFVDKSWDTEVPVFHTPVGKVGLAICYEIRFPEVFRTLALAGADIVALPTNWPEQSRLLATHFTRVRAAENLVYVMAANRHDSEGGIRFLGLSQIVDPRGELVADAGHEEGIFAASLDLELARTKRIVFRKGEFEVSPWSDRRPETYHL
jgi:predicted amidohydrolase